MSSILRGFFCQIYAHVFFRDHSFNMFAESSAKLTYLASRYARVRIVSFSENFANVLNECSLRDHTFRDGLQISLLILSEFK